jgi:UDP-glucose 4-epimerase
MFENKVLLVTGGSGSFGNAVISHFLRSDIREIRIFSRDEKKQDYMRRHYNDDRLRFYIGDVRDFDSISPPMAGVDFVFCAAALKQVPTCEFFPLEAVKTNVIGTENTLNAAVANNAESVIVLSTDKAVYPINAMGMTKALMEKVMIARSRNVENGHTVLCGTRYGNVMASRGSVIPLFVDQIKSEKSLTVTNPNMTRFMMSLEGAVDLVLYAFVHGKQGDIFVKKAPAATIMTLAEALKEIFDADNEIRIIGTRHGEKLYESLLTSEEMLVAEDLGDYYRIPADARDLNYSIYFEKGKLLAENVEPYTSHNTRRLSVEELKKLLLKLDYIQDELRKWRSAKG